MHVTFIEATHSTCRSKKLTRITNPLGLWTSYDEVERIDTALAEHTIDMSGSHRVPVTPSF